MRQQDWRIRHEGKVHILHNVDDVGEADEALRGGAERQEHLGLSSAPQFDVNEAIAVYAWPPAANSKLSSIELSQVNSARKERVALSYVGVKTYEEVVSVRMNARNGSAVAAG